ncbi:hypothetical protein C8R47DRAFT_1080101 [Mycena vitilis]|nr:hypothetical protein C8R47DRAFT_1080101 [Mycena vitilis]
MYQLWGYRPKKPTGRNNAHFINARFWDSNKGPVSVYRQYADRLVGWFLRQYTDANGNPWIFAGFVGAGECINLASTFPLAFPTMAASSKTSNGHRPASQRSQMSSTPADARKLQQLRERRRAASARYRERHRTEVLEAGRIRAAERRATLKDDEGSRARAREASARYRSQNRESSLPSNAKEVESPSPPPDDPPEANYDGDDEDNGGRVYAAPLGWDYDPCLKRW